MKHILALLATTSLAVAITITTQFSKLAITNYGINQKSVIASYEKIQAPKGQSLGNMSLITGPLQSGSIVGGGIFDNTGSSLIFAGNGNDKAPDGIIFTGAMESPIEWTHANANTYTLTGTATGTFIKGQRARAMLSEVFVSFTNSQNITTYTQVGLATTEIILLGPQQLSKKINLLTPFNLEECGTEPPICKGGLLKQSATLQQINDYWTKYNLTVPLSCRFMEPPLCATGEKELCSNECSQH